MTSIIRDYQPAFEEIISGLVSDTLTAGRYELTMADGAVYLAPYREFEDQIPQDLKDAIEQARQDILSGDLVVPAVFELSE
jgi:basic membrane protein A